MNNLKILIWNSIFFKVILAYSNLVLVVLLSKLKKEYQGAKFFCRVYRYIYNENDKNRKVFNLEKILYRHYQKFFETFISDLVYPENKIYKSYLKSVEAKKIQKYFSQLDQSYYVSLKYPRKNDYPQRQGDLMILKCFNHSNQEKGVLLIQYTESFAKFAAVYDLDKIAQRYQIILEPSWWGYQNVNFLFFYKLPTEVIIQCPYHKDYSFIKKLDHNFYPVKIGAGDWVDPETFGILKPNEKKYDIVMVGNWSKIKRHKILFQSLSKLENSQDYKIALIGYPSHGRTMADVKEEAKLFNLDKRITFFERIKPSQVSQILSESKLNLLLSLGEGANRGIYEGLFCGNVLIVYKYNRGVNRTIINEHTGFLADDNELPYIIEKAIDMYNGYDTANWARKNTGYRNSSKKLNEILKKITQINNRAWTTNLVEKKNMPNGLYANENGRLKLLPEYEKISACLYNN